MANNEDLKGYRETIIELPPISKLTEDLLWRIFITNTDNTNIKTSYESPRLYDPYYKVRNTTLRPLKITRFSSQVSREWRTILLTSTSIWGRLIDFVSFSKGSNHWRDEVISRSGTSMLWVIGGRSSISSSLWTTKGDPDYLNPAQLFFIEFLSHHWERIEKLFVNGWIGEDCSVLCRPAPNLKVFDICSPGLLKSIQIPGAPETIFTGHAPQLRSFRTADASFCLSIDWMANIRDLSLSGHRFSNQEVFKVLRRLPRLESLELKDHDMVSGYHPPAVVHLPRLHTMSIDGCLEYVGNIEPGPKCTFIIHERRKNIMSNLSHEDALARLYHNYLDLHPPRIIALSYRCKFIGLRSWYLSESSVDDRFEMQFECEGTIPKDSFVYFLEAFISPQLLEVPALSLNIDNWHGSHSWHQRHQPRILEAFKKFAVSFASLDGLWLNEDTLPILLEEKLATSLIFPHLRVLNIFRLRSSSQVYKPKSNYLERFLDLRQKLGVPISIIDLTCLMTSHLRDLDALDKYVGMKIRFSDDGSRIRQYECGSGHPEVLRFQSQRSE